MSTIAQRRQKNAPINLVFIPPKKKYPVAESKGEGKDAQHPPTPPGSASAEGKAKNAADADGKSKGKAVAQNPPAAEEGDVKGKGKAVAQTPPTAGGAETKDQAVPKRSKAPKASRPNEETFPDTPTSPEDLMDICPITPVSLASPTSPQWLLAHEDHDMTIFTPRTTQSIITQYIQQHLSEPFANLVSILANCKFEHSRQNQNPFSALSNQRGGFGKPAGGNDENPYLLKPDVIVRDLTEERPSWTLSAYGPGRDAPEQLWGGPIEQSFEEMRLHFELAAAQGNPQAALNDIQQLDAQVQQKIQAAINDPKAAVNYIMSAVNNHPNRHDLCRNDPSQPTGEFAVGKRPVGVGQPQPQPSNPFGQPSALGQNASPFAAPTPGFGQASALGQSSSPFGQPSAPAQSSPFGQPSALGQTSALGGGGGFGQTSALGQKPNPFGQPSGGASTGFGQTSMMGQKPNPFGTPGFGTTSQLGSKPNPFMSGSSAPAAPAASPFSAFAANNTNNAPAASPFSTLSGASTSNANAQQPSPFGQPQPPPTAEVSMDTNPTAGTSAFGQSSTTAAPANPFSQPSASVFGQPSQPASSPFGQPAQPPAAAAAAANPFAQASSAASPFGTAAAPQQQAAHAPSSNPYAPKASRQHPPLSSYAIKGPDGRLQRWKGQPVTYKEIDGVPTPGVQTGGFGKQQWSRIWFPNGPPNYYQATEPDAEYTDGDKAAWEKFVSGGGRFELAAAGGGGMPMAPPMREFVTWDF